jgi:hypothetical protein
MNNYYYYDPQTEAYRQAERRVKAKLGFYWHLASYVVVNGFLITIYLVTSWADNGLYYFWPIWPLLGWGVGLFFNFLAVFVFPDTPASRQKMIEKELGTMSNYTLPAQTPAEYPNYQYPSQPAPTYANKPVEAQVTPEKTPVS